MENNYHGSMDELSDIFSVNMNDGVKTFTWLYVNIYKASLEEALIILEKHILNVINFDLYVPLLIGYEEEFQQKYSLDEEQQEKCISTMITTQLNSKIRLYHPRILAEAIYLYCCLNTSDNNLEDNNSSLKLCLNELVSWITSIKVDDKLKELSSGW